MADLKGKVALVTGATSGLGLETAAALAGGARSVHSVWRAAGPTLPARCEGASIAAPMIVLSLIARGPPARAARGASVILGVRNVEAGKQVAEQIK